ncbi:MAG: hypothetical protein GF334_08885 [Candidatus Altiarchaeales archaeon]|nr:hypothetical protein [Candidatus Altiarchaeales archaeon]
MRLETNVLGVFVLREGRIIESELFPEDVEQIADQLKKTSQGVCEAEEKILDRLIETGVDEVLVDRPKRFPRKEGIKYLQTREPGDLFDLGSQLGLSRDYLKRRLTEVNKNLTSEKLRSRQEDALIIQAVESLDDLTEAGNLLNERLHEWYGLHYPELSEHVKKPDVYSKLVAEFGLRGNLELGEIGLDENQRQRIKESLKNSLGVDFKTQDIHTVSKLASGINTLYETQSGIEDYVRERMREFAPNLSGLLDEVLAAKLLAYAGSLKQLAILPSGTIQVLGAEDAFFRFLKSGGKPPKHGVIFMHPDIAGSDKKIRGKLARTLASKIAIAAKLDAFKGENQSMKLRKQFSERVKSLKTN